METETFWLGVVGAIVLLDLHGLYVLIGDALGGKWYGHYQRSDITPLSLMFLTVTVLFAVVYGLGILIRTGLTLLS